MAVQLRESVHEKRYSKKENPLSLILCGNSDVTHFFFQLVHGVKKNQKHFDTPNKHSELPLLVAGKVDCCIAPEVELEHFTKMTSDGQQACTS